MAESAVTVGIVIIASTEVEGELRVTDKHLANWHVHHVLSPVIRKVLGWAIWLVNCQTGTGQIGTLSLPSAIDNV